jgi:hypothetical protein
MTDRRPNCLALLLIALACGSERDHRPPSPLSVQHSPATMGRVQDSLERPRMDSLRRLYDNRIPTELRLGSEELRVAFRSIAGCYQLSLSPSSPRVVKLETSEAEGPSPGGSHPWFAVSEMALGDNAAEPARWWLVSRDSLVFRGATRGILRFSRQEKGWVAQFGAPPRSATLLPVRCAR